MSVDPRQTGRDIPGSSMPIDAGDDGVVFDRTPAQPSLPLFGIVPPGVLSVGGISGGIKVARRFRRFWM